MSSEKDLFYGRIICFDSVGGASGDMILGGLIRLGEQLSLFTASDILADLHALIPDHFDFRREAKLDCGIKGESLHVELEHEHGNDHQCTHDHCEHDHCEHDHCEHDHGRDEKHCTCEPAHDHCEHDNNHKHEDSCEHDHSHEHDHRHKHDHSHEHDHSNEHDHCHEHEHRHEHDHEHEHHSHDHGGHSHTHEHHSYSQIKGLLEQSSLPSDVKSLSLKVFEVLAEAEGSVHGVPVSDVRFHEVGAVDSIVDIVGTCLAWGKLLSRYPDLTIRLSPLPLGSGVFTCAHGVYPLPAPATQALVCKYKLPVNTCISAQPSNLEMVTPTAASLFSVLPREKQGANALADSALLVAEVNQLGHRKFSDRPNLLRITLMEMSASDRFEADETDRGLDYPSSDLYELSCNIDDLTGELLGASMEGLFNAGALDVWYTPIYMKKCRPAYQVSVLVGSDKRVAVLNRLFMSTSTFGVRQTAVCRYELNRELVDVTTVYGVVPVKVGSVAGREVHFAAEFEPCRELARLHNIDVSVVMNAACAAYAATCSQAQKEDQ